MRIDTPTITSDPVLLIARRACYRFVALALADPQIGTGTELTEVATFELITQATEILREEDTAVARPLALGERPLADLDPARVFARLPPSVADLNEIYEATFGLLGGSKCPQYEVEYVPSKFTFQRSNMLADVAGFYRAFGLEISNSHPDRPDHIVVQCEFIAHLLELERQASQSPGEDAAPRVAICREAQRRFLQEHIVWWFPAFARLLARQDPGGFYEAIAQFLAALVAAERALAHIEPPCLAVEPSPIEIPEECSGCELAIR
jgi:TorA maturation chaperone TorD